MPSDHLILDLEGKKLRVERCGYGNEEDFKKVFADNIAHIAEELKSALELEEEEGSEERIVLCGKEVKLSLGNSTPLSADALLLDIVEGTPIIIEAKLRINREARREVLGQILEYMSLAYLDPEALVGKCYEAIEEEKREEILEKMKEKIEQKRIIGLIVADRLPEVVKQVIEVFNEDLKNFILLGMELEKYCSDKENIKIILPSLVGITAKKKAGMSKGRKRLWRYDDLKEYIESIEDDKFRKRALEILEWAHENDLLLYKGETTSPLIRIANVATRKVIARVYLNNGSIEVNIGPENEKLYPDPNLRKMFFRDLKQKNLIDLDYPDERKFSASLSKKLNELTEDEYKYLFEVIKKYAFHTGETS